MVCIRTRMRAFWDFLGSQSLWMGVFLESTELYECITRLVHWAPKVKAIVLPDEKTFSICLGRIKPTSTLWNWYVSWNWYNKYYIYMYYIIYICILYIYLPLLTITFSLDFPSTWPEEQHQKAGFSRHPPHRCGWSPASAPTCSSRPCPSSWGRGSVPLVNQQTFGEK